MKDLGHRQMVRIAYYIHANCQHCLQYGTVLYKNCTNQGAERLRVILRSGVLLRARLRGMFLIDQALTHLVYISNIFCGQGVPIPYQISRLLTLYKILLIYTNSVSTCFIRWIPRNNWP